MDLEKQGAAVNDINASDEAIAAELGALGIDIGAEEGSEQAAVEVVTDVDRDGYARRLANILTMPVMAMFAVMAPGWKITTDEGGRLTFVWSRVLAKYVPASWLHYIPAGDGSGSCVECDAVAVTLEVVGPRMVAKQQVREVPEVVAPVARVVGESMPDLHGVRS